MANLRRNKFLRMLRNCHIIVSTYSVRAYNVYGGKRTMYFISKSVKTERGRTR